MAGVLRERATKGKGICRSCPKARVPFSFFHANAENRPARQDVERESPSALVFAEEELARTRITTRKTRNENFSFQPMLTSPAIFSRYARCRPCACARRRPRPVDRYGRRPA